MSHCACRCSNRCSSASGQLYHHLIFLFQLAEFDSNVLHFELTRFLSVFQTAMSCNWVLSTRAHWLYGQRSILNLKASPRTRSLQAQPQQSQHKGATRLLPSEFRAAHEVPRCIPGGRGVRGRWGRGGCTTSPRTASAPAIAYGRSPAQPSPQLPRK